jgi:hypothetical protein
MVFNHRDRVTLANEMNLGQREVRRMMLKGFSSARQKPRALEETQTFSLLLQSVFTGIQLNADSLVQSGILTSEQLQFYQRLGVRTVGDFFSRALEQQPHIDRQQLEQQRQQAVESVRTLLRNTRNGNR